MNWSKNDLFGKPPEQVQSDESSPSFPNQEQEESKVAAAPKPISGSAQKFLGAADANDSDDNAYGVEAISVKADQVYDPQ